MPDCCAPHFRNGYMTDSDAAMEYYVAAVPVARGLVRKTSSSSSVKSRANDWPRRTRLVAASTLDAAAVGWLIGVLGSGL